MNKMKVYEIKNHIVESNREGLTEDYKTRNDERQHKGMDFVSVNLSNKSTTDYIKAIEKGIVALVGKNASVGNYVIIKHPCGLYSAYYHLKDNSIVVKKGQQIEKGQRIGYMGNTGKSDGAHIHIGILTSTNMNDDIDPLPYLNGEKSLLEEQWTTGKYKLLVAKTIRTSCSLTPLNRVKVKECRTDVKPKLTSKKSNDIAMFKIGTELDITEIKKGNNGRVWGKLRTDYIVLCNADGTPQAKRV